MIRHIVPIVALAAVGGLGAQEPCESAAQAAKSNIVEIAASAGSFSKLIAAVKAAGLSETLMGKGPFTVFAPSDEAFAKLPEGALDKLLADKKALAGVLAYHVVPGRWLAADVAKMPWAATVNGQSLRLQATGGQVTVDSARVVKADIQASNGVIHVIDSVVMPRADIVDTAVAAGSFQTLAKALAAAGLVDALKGKGPFTVFAPTDEAFAKLPKGTLEGLLKDIPKLKAILTYHVVAGRTLSTDIAMAEGEATSVAAQTLNGGKVAIVRAENGVTVNGANVVKADVLAGNGVIHVIDRVILPE